MATTVSAWAKPGAWALDSEEHEASETEMLHQKSQGGDNAPAAAEPSADFPSLAAAVATKTSKKKKGQTLSLAEFNNGGAPVTHGSAKFQVRSASFSSPAPADASKGLTPDERLMLPTGPRERTAEELERGGTRGFGGYYGGVGGGRPRDGGEDSVSRWESSRLSDEPRRGGFGGAGSNRDLAPSRADEIDDWGANKRSVPPPMERRERTGGFFDSQSKADDSDSWISNKSSAAASTDGRRMGDGFRERRGFDMFNREASSGFGGRSDSETWGKRNEDLGGERPRLKLQPRTLPLANGDSEQRTERPKGNGVNPFGMARPREEVLAEKALSASSEDGDHQVEPQPQVPRSKGLNPFGTARPREEVLAEKGQNWKEIDQRLESIKVRDATTAASEGHASARKGFGLGNGPGNEVGDRTERSWRKTDPVDSPAAFASVEGPEEPAAEDD